MTLASVKKEYSNTKFVIYYHVTIIFLALKFLLVTERLNPMPITCCLSNASKRHPIYSTNIFFKTITYNYILNRIINHINLYLKALTNNLNKYYRLNHTIYLDDKKKYTY